MESINKIELLGYVGNVSIQTVGEKRMARFSLCTETVYGSEKGTPVIDNTWFNCTAWESEKIPTVTIIEKGKPIHITGRMRMARYQGKNGIEVPIMEVICQTVEEVKEGD